MTIYFNCPNCTQQIETPDHLSGTSLGCAQCGNINVVPLPNRSPKNNFGAAPPISRIVYILVAVIVGQFGIHNFLAGYTSRAVVQLLVTVLTLGIGGIVIYIWAIVEACTVWQDADGRTMT